MYRCAGNHDRYNNFRNESFRIRKRFEFVCEARLRKARCWILIVCYEILRNILNGSRNCIVFANSAVKKIHMRNGFNFLYMEIYDLIKNINIVINKICWFWSDWNFGFDIKKTRLTYNNVIIDNGNQIVEYSDRWTQR